MERLIFKNAMSAKWVIGTFVLSSVVLQKVFFRSQLLAHDVFGADGNGGTMIKIITLLTDEEMARLKYVRRLYWHWKGSRQMKDGREAITDQELADRGIEVTPEPFSIPIRVNASPE